MKSFVQPRIDEFEKSRQAWIDFAADKYFYDEPNMVNDYKRLSQRQIHLSPLGSRFNVLTTSTKSSNSDNWTREQWDAYYQQNHGEDDANQYDPDEDGSDGEHNGNDDGQDQFDDSFDNFLPEGVSWADYMDMWDEHERGPNDVRSGYQTHTWVQTENGGWYKEYYWVWD